LQDRHKKKQALFTRIEQNNHENYADGTTQKYFVFSYNYLTLLEEKV